MLINLVHPSRARASRAHDTFTTWMSRAERPEMVRHILSIDEDDEVSRYAALFRNSTITINPNRSAVDAANAGGKLVHSGAIILMSDDFDCPVGWDEMIRPVIASNPGKLIKTYDGIQRWLVTLPIMDYQYYKWAGYIYHPDYFHMFCDTDMTHMAEVAGRLHVANDITFQHNHYSTGKSAKDHVNKRADASFESGKQIYLRRVRDGFGLGKINPITTGCKNHNNWLKSNL